MRRRTKVLIILAIVTADVLIAMFAPVIPAAELKPTTVLYLKPSPGFNSALEFDAQYSGKNTGLVFLTNHSPYILLNASFIMSNFCNGAGNEQFVTFYYEKIYPGQRAAPIKVVVETPFGFSFDTNSCQVGPYSTCGSYATIHTYVVGEEEWHMVSLAQWLGALRPSLNQTQPEPAPIFECI